MAALVAPAQEAAHQLHMAPFIRSAAVPWMRVLTALRSASSRALPRAHGAGAGVGGWGGGGEGYSVR